MEDNVKKQLLKFLLEAKDAVSKEDSDDLKDISNHVMYYSSLYEDEDMISLSVVMYAVAKLVTRQKVKLEANSRALLSEIKSLIGDMAEQVETDQLDAFRKTMKRLSKEIIEIDSRVKFFMGDVLREAKVKKGSVLYEQGLSVERISDLLGVSQWEMMNYVGKTAINETHLNDGKVKQRLELTRNIFAGRRK